MKRKVWNSECVGCVECEVWSAECEVWSVKCGVKCSKCEVYSVRCEVWSVECDCILECGTWSSGKCGVWGLMCGELSVQCGVWSGRQYWEVPCASFVVLGSTGKCRVQGLLYKVVCCTK